jgi:putative CocE/NonD family hydrolase
MPKIAIILCALAAVFSLAATHSAQPDEDGKKLAEYIAASYTKYEHRIPMRDGKKLFTAVYAPKDESREYPIMLLRTPYGIAPYGVDRLRERLGPSEHFAREGFIFVYQDVRGRFLSEGIFLETTPQRPLPRGPQEVDESTDAWDTIDWLVKNVPNNNGKAGMWGISYPGFYAAAGMIDAHPALRAVSPQAPVTDLFSGDDSFHNGAFMLAANFGFYTFFEKQDDARLPEPRIDFDYKNKDGYDFFLELGPLASADELYFKGKNPYWTSLMTHTTYDKFWQDRALQRHLRKVAPAVLTVGGYFDAEDPVGPGLIYQGVENASPEVDNHLVLGPWAHGGWSHGKGDSHGDVSFHLATGEYFRKEIEFEFFRRHLLGDGKKKEADFPKAWIFETGTNRWRKFGQWPPRDAAKTKLYLSEGGNLSFAAPAAESGADEYQSDPAKPVPYWNGIANGVQREYMTADQRFAAKRPDVLAYQGETLEDDLTVCGPVSPTLWVASTGTDADFVVKLIDVYPLEYPNPDPNPNDVEMGGYQQLVRGEPFRAKFRNGFEKPEPLEPGKLAKIQFTFPDICHVFRRGHAIMVQVQSSWFPLVDRNPQSFTDIPNAKPEDFKKATQTISRSREKASYLELPILAPAAPKN